MSPSTPGPSASQESRIRATSSLPPPSSSSLIHNRDNLAAPPPTSIPDEVEVAGSAERVSFYVQAVDDMIECISEKEEHLFSPLENKALKRFQELAYGPRYLFVRLYLRKRGWIRAAEITNSYGEEIDDIESALDVLCEKEDGFIGIGKKEKEKEKEKKKEKKGKKKVEVIDLTIGDSDGEEEEDDAEVKEDEDKIEKVEVEVNNDDDDEFKGFEDEEGIDYSCFGFPATTLRAQGTKIVLAWLTLDELKSVAKKLKVASPKGSSRVAAWTEVLLGTAKQSMLSFSPISNNKGGSLSVDFKSNGTKSSLETLVTFEALKILGECILLNKSYINLFDRLSLVYHRRSTSSSDTTALTSSLLARFGKRNYPEYEVKRSYSIFPDRKTLKEFEEAVEIERKMEEALGDFGWSAGGGDRGGRDRKGKRVEAEDAEEEENNQTPQPNKKQKGKEGQSISTINRSTASSKVAEETKLEREKVWKDALDIFVGFEDRWKEMMVEEKILRKGKDKTELALVYYRKRFHPGWPLTRAAYKAAAIHARLGQHKEEIDILTSLLQQTVFRRGKRGEWWERIALVFMNYPSEEETKLDFVKDGERLAELVRDRRETAFNCCERGLVDPYTHVVYKAALERRRARLENLLEIPQASRKKIERVLSKAEIRIMEGERLDEGVAGKHSVWQANDGEEVSVEKLALEGYEKEGWKGFHSENGILSMIFALLFWDILFAPIDGVFETAYQPAPLDLTTDSFSILRKDLIMTRYEEIQADNAPSIMRAVDIRERPKQTFCVGVNWVKYSRKDLIEIVKCIGGQALAELLLVFAEEYSHRSGGVPDLILWNFSEKECMFAEVKGPGDTLSSSQRVWIDLMLKVGIKVQVCKVMTSEMVLLEEEKSNKRKKANASRKRKRKANTSDNEEEEDELDDD